MLNATVSAGWERNTRNGEELRSVRSALVFPKCMEGEQALADRA